MSGQKRNYIGLTGGIGAGKSTVAARFALLGAAVIDADAISRRALEPDGCCYAGVVQLFGPGVLGLFVELHDAPGLVGVENAETVRFFPGNLQFRDGRIRLVFDMEAQHGVVVHAVNVVA